MSDDAAAAEPNLDAAFVYAPHLASWTLSADHPFKPVRLALVKDLLETAGLLHPHEIVAPARLRAGELSRVHDAEYLEMVARVSRGERPEEAFRFGLGTADTPVVDGLHESVQAVCAATVTAMQLVIDGRTKRAATFSGGLHHAMPDRASGFCVYDDLALAILRATDHGLRVAYLDLDAHHGDGVQHVFYDRADVLTISVHESGRYLFPGTGHSYELGTGAGRGLSVNLPLEPFTEDDSYLEAFDEVVPRALRAFAPDLLLVQAGADPHRDDPLADLSLTLSGMRDVYRRVAALADELTGGRWIVTGGGGYETFSVAPRAWAQAWSAMTGRDVPDRLPDAWRERWRDAAGGPLPGRALDGPDDYPPQPRRLQVQGHNTAVAKRLSAVLEPIWRDHEAMRTGATTRQEGTS
ncbi:MAG: acetoin utilization protein AcuC [Trueperaceae bacterium]|nr:acetoin utilization protein AcuC [Trueperaceae bacterium]